MSDKRWYVVHAYSGYEKQVMASIQDRIERAEAKLSKLEPLRQWLEDHSDWMKYEYPSAYRELYQILGDLE